MNRMNALARWALIGFAAAIIVALVEWLAR